MPRTSSHRRLTAWVSPAVACDVVRVRSVEVQTFAQTSETVARCIEEVSADAIVFDPAAHASAAEAAVALRALRQRFPVTPIVVYGRLTKRLAEMVCDLADDPVTPVVLLQATDGPERLDRTLSRLAQLRATDRVLVGLQRNLEALPEALAARIRDAFHRPLAYRTIEDLVADLPISRRHAYRHFEAAGFPAAKELLLAARLTYVFEALKRPSVPLRDVGALAGYEDHGTFARHMRRVVGVLPRAVRKQWSAAEFVERVIASITGQGEVGPKRLLDTPAA